MTGSKQIPHQPGLVPYCTGNIVDIYILIVFLSSALLVINFAFFAIVKKSRTLNMKI